MKHNHEVLVEIKGSKLHMQLRRDCPLCQAIETKLKAKPKRKGNKT